MSGERMVGRDGELGRLLTLLDDAEAGRPVAALVSGDAGVGKTRLVNEVTRLAAGRGFTVLSGQCAELGDSVPYLPLAGALRGAGESTGVRDALRSRPALGRLLPDGGEGPIADSDRSGLARQQMFGGVLGLLAELAAAAPVLLVLEDLHWADASTRDLVTFLSRMLRRERVALIGSYRTDDLHRRHPLRPVVAELLRLPSVTAVDLAPLNRSALAEHLGAAARGRIGATELNDIVARAEGNAYYAEELLAASVSADPGQRQHPAGGPGRAAAQPGRAAVRRRPAGAPRGGGGRPPSRRRAGAGRVWPGARRLRGGGPRGGHPPAAGGRRLGRLRLPARAAARGRLRGPAAGGADQAARHHELAAVREHRLAMPGTAAELAHHCLASHDIPGAFAASVRAGTEAERLGAPAEAHRHYDQALALWDRVAEPGATAGMARGKLGLLSATNAADSGDVARAVHLLRRIRQMFATRVTPGVEPPDEKLPSRIGERLAFYLMLLEDPKAVAEAVEVARETVEAASGGPADLAVRAGPHHLRLRPAGGGRRRRGPGLGRARLAAGPRRRRALGRGGRAGHPRHHGQPRGPQRRGQRAADRRAQAGPRRRWSSAWNCGPPTSWPGPIWSGATLPTARRSPTRAPSGHPEGLGLAPYGMDLQHLHFQCHFATASGTTRRSSPTVSRSGSPACPRR